MKDNRVEGTEGGRSYQHSCPGKTWTVQRGSWVHPPPVGHTNTQLRHLRFGINSIMCHKGSAAWHAKLASVERAWCKNELRFCLVSMRTADTSGMSVFIIQKSWDTLWKHMMTSLLPIYKGRIFNVQTEKNFFCKTVFCKNTMWIWCLQLILGEEGQRHLYHSVPFLLTAIS